MPPQRASSTLALLRRILLLIILSLLAVPVPGSAQVSLSGLADARFVHGGEESAPLRNGLSSGSPHFQLRDLYLFAESSPAPGVTISGALRASSADMGSLDPLEVMYLSVTFWEVAGPALNLEAGRVLSPFGTYPRRQFPDQDPLITEPLAYSRGVNISRHSGLSQASGTVYDTTGTVPTLYGKHYVTGIKVFGTLLGGQLEYDAALSSEAPAASIPSSANENERLGLSGRVGLLPFPWLTAGISFSSGGYLVPSPANMGFDLSRYAQTVLGLDLTLQALYYELIVELVNSTWQSPYLEPVATPPTDRFELDNQILSAEFKAQVPQVPGLWAAGRFEQMTFGEIWEDIAAWSGNTVPWDDAVTRFQAGLGYRLSRPVTLKASHTVTSSDRDPEWDDDVTAVQLAVVF